MQSRLLTFTNSKGESITFRDDSPFIVSQIDGLGDVDADIQLQKAPYQDGSTFVDSVLKERSISFTVTILGNGDTDISEKRSRLSRIFNPRLGAGMIEYKYGDIVRLAEAVSEHVPHFPSGLDNRGSGLQVSLIDLICPNPFWRSPDIEEEPTFEPLLEFPFEGEFEMGMQRDKRIIVNDGDAPAPIQIEFFGPAKKPKIINNTTGEYIKINQELLEGERMLVNTSDDEKSVYFVSEDGEQRNVFNWIDLNSTFFKLQIGENEIEYSADSDIQGAIVNIRYKKLYAAV
ncbi:phage tail family protein [Peribacillus loiseleuriae]|uniref:phage tail family protein n=1 Tax=Peribacillus loiseleuriae TaxID=1679170 RepID=UPI0037F958F0